MTDLAEPVEDLPKYLAMKLVELGLKQRRDMDHRQIAGAFIAAGVAISNSAFGPFLTAEWLRDIADEFERLSEPEAARH